MKQNDYDKTWRLLKQQDQCQPKLAGIISVLFCLTVCKVFADFYFVYSNLEEIPTKLRREKSNFNVVPSTVVKLFNNMQRSVIIYFFVI